MQRGFASVALHNLSPAPHGRPAHAGGQTGMRASAGDPALGELHQALAALTGIPLPAIAAAEQHMAVTGQLGSLKILLAHPAHRLRGGTERYEFRIASRRTRHVTPARTLCVRSRLSLAVWSSRGALQVTVDMVVPSAGPTGGPARFWVAYRFRIGDLERSVVREINVRPDQARAA